MTRPRRSLAFAAMLALTVPSVAVVTLAGPVHAAIQVRYTYVDLDVLGAPNSGQPSSRAHDINAGGQVVGYSSATGTPSAHAFGWQVGAMTDLGTYYSSPFVLSSAQAVNDNGDVVGHGNVNESDPSHALLFRDGQVLDLGTGLGVGSGSHANDINDAGVVVGARVAAQGMPERAVIWQNGTIRELGTFGGTAGRFGTESIAYAINNSGLVVGAALPASGRLHGFVWDGRGLRDIGTLGGDDEATIARDINDLGQITGYSPNAAGRVDAFLWEQGLMHDLGVLPGATGSFGYGINNRGQVVGVAGFGSVRDPDRHFRAFIWQDGVMTDLQTLVDDMPPDVTLWAGLAINDDGVIVGATCVGRCYSDHRLVAGHAFMLVPRSATGSG
jgi:probable HAF family extracellular repeat protein